MEHKTNFLLMFLLFLGFSFLLFSAAVPTSRIIKSFKDDPSVQDFLAQNEMDTMTKNGVLSAGEEEVVIEGRMDIESTSDYPGTGANNHHDPKSPGRF